MRPLVSGASLVLLISGSALGQQVTGRVMDVESGSPVAGATVVLEDSIGTVAGRAVATELGTFRLWQVEPGTYQLTAERIGYAPVTDQTIQLDSAQVVEVEIRMRPEAVVLEPLQVLARRKIRRGTPDEFYDRMDRLADRGTFITREDIEASSFRIPSQLVSLAPGTWVQPQGMFRNTIDLMSYGRRCRPQVYLNGFPVRPDVGLDEMTVVDRVEGIEVYRGHYVPDTYALDIETWGCGAVLVWTRTDYDPRWASSWGRWLKFGAVGGVVLGLGLLF